MEIALPCIECADDVLHTLAASVAAMAITIVVVGHFSSIILDTKRYQLLLGALINANDEDDFNFASLSFINVSICMVVALCRCL